LVTPIAVAAAALGLLTILRLVMAALLPLSPDEAYYWVWSRALAPGYADHPPMVALWIRAGTWVAGECAIGVRLLGPLSAALGSALLWDTAERLLPARNAGIWAVLLLNSMLLAGAGAIIVTPDSPLLFFWTCALWAMARLIAGGSGAWWLAVGLFVGLAVASKYTAVLLVLGIALWLASAERIWLMRREPYLGAALMLIVVTPVLWWNACHGWVSFLRQGGRAGNWSPERAPQFLLELFGGQIALATPLIFLLCAAGMALAARSAWRRWDPAWSLLAILTLFPVLVFVQHAIGDRVQSNWPAIIYPAAVIAAAGLSARFWRRLRLPAIALGLLITGAVYVQAAFMPLALPAKLDPIALQMSGWRGLAAAVADARRATAASFVAADNYGLAAELARHLPADVPVIAIGPRWSSFSLPAAAVDGMSGLLVQSEHHATPIWSAAEVMGTVTRESRGVLVERYRLYRVRPDRSTSAVLLPHPSSR
jgi:4-amino-4-deoxy-L-arabinose transferase-like glycosyltransferase